MGKVQKSSRFEIQLRLRFVQLNCTFTNIQKLTVFLYAGMT